ncbi:hypothetical protein COOONC_09917 [Cooperia oncophora]
MSLNASPFHCCLLPTDRYVGEFQCYDLFDDDKGLPWKRCERDEILTMKQRFDSNVGKSLVFILQSLSCYSIVPEDFKRIVQYIDGLKYADEPDYIYLRNSLAAIAKEARVDFNKPLDWIGITSKKRDKPKSGSEEVSSDNRQEETGSGEKEEESKDRSRYKSSRAKRR